ncbi:uncharacterized protein LOC123698461 [Colias croceus]|uniref:uncharacterized protein LOC123698461 n=1 Tax=Colias crocea TaxID=72248 RepID=UPI001E27CF64|nr:uncharacterized protein LOC123698461 [Colias croceus]
MDGPSLEHSDSDSGESWTLLESNPALAEEAPDFAETLVESPVPDNQEKDDDTDGISIITDSDHETPSPYQMNYDNFLSEEVHPNDPEISQYVSVNTPLTHLNNTNETLRDEDDFLGDNGGKHRIYVHRRNKRLSTVLNIIVLGSVITAAGVAIGHMWGAKNDCAIHTTPAVNKILSNLYKLQEENAYLRSKLKDLSSLYQSQQKLPHTTKQNRCKKMFEEPLTNKNVNIPTKCVDEKSDNLESHLVEPSYEKEFIVDISKLENVYKENKGWLDEEITKRLKLEEEMWSNNINKYIKNEKLGKSNVDIANNDTVATAPEDKNQNTTKEINLLSDELPQKEIKYSEKVSYADSLKTDQQDKKIYKREISKNFENHTDKYINKNKFKSINDKSTDYPLSEEEIKKDDRYTGNKKEKKKYNRNKTFKKQKRQNKYEQWEMNGGFIKDYDDLSLSSQDADLTSNNSDQVTLSDVPKLNKNVDKNTETNKIEPKIRSQRNKEKLHKKENEKQDDWYEKRVAFRNQARKKVEQALFGEMAPNTARWYFKRMQKREQCRVKDNSTNRKSFQKRDMNYKMKH